MVYIHKRYILHYTFKRDSTLPLKITHPTLSRVEKNLEIVYDVSMR